MQRLWNRLWENPDRAGEGLLPDDYEKLAEQTIEIKRMRTVLVQKLRVESKMCDLLRFCGAGDGDRTRDVQLGNRNRLIASIDFIGFVGGNMMQSCAKCSQDQNQSCTD